METTEIKKGILIVILILVIISTCMIGCPAYRVYNQRKTGEADLAQAQYSRLVAVAEARAKYEASALLAASDTIRAHGIAKSNEIIGKSLENNPAYLSWLWIDELKSTKNQIIYVPSGIMGLPIQEATRLK